MNLLFVLVTWNRGMGSDADDWLKLLADNIDSWATELNIYPDRITPETTLGDLGGHLLIKSEHQCVRIRHGLSFRRR